MNMPLRAQLVPGCDTVTYDSEPDSVGREDMVENSSEGRPSGGVPYDEHYYSPGNCYSLASSGEFDTAEGVADAEGTCWSTHGPWPFIKTDRVQTSTMETTPPLVLVEPDALTTRTCCCETK